MNGKTKKVLGRGRKGQHVTFFSSVSPGRLIVSLVSAVFTSRILDQTLDRGFYALLTQRACVERELRGNYVADHRLTLEFREDL